jgi:site-specific recombinase XerD
MFDPTDPENVRLERQTPRTESLRRLAPPVSSLAKAAIPAEIAAWTITDMSFRFRDYLVTARTVEQKSPDTLRGYQWAFDNFVKFLRAQGVADDRPLGQFLLAIEAWVGWNTTRGLSGVSTNSLWRALRAFYRDLEKRDGLPNPFVGMKPPVMPTVIPKARTPAELRQILFAAENFPWPTSFDRARAIAVLGTLIYSGVRKRELLNLAFTDVDLTEETIFIRRGKGKGGGKDRVTYISPELRTLLTGYLKERTRARVVAPGFFASRQGGPMMSESSLRRIVACVRRASCVPFSIHSLRHSFVTMMIRNNVPLHVVQSLAGHASLVTTAGYLRVFDDDGRKGVAKFRLRM